MKAMSSVQILVTILFLCLITSGIAFIGFWQYFHLRAEIEAGQVNAVEQVNP
jgi:hypothetical protein